MPPLLTPVRSPSNGPDDYFRVKQVQSFQELVSTEFAGGVNAHCWQRTLAGDFGEVVSLLGSSDEGIVTLDEDQLLALPVTAAGRSAIDALVADLRLLRNHGVAPVLNCIRAYPRDEDPVVVPTDVFSFHADSAPIQADTFLCTYHGAVSEGLRNEEAQRRVDIPATRAELLKLFGGGDDAAFREFLNENCYDLHYAPMPTARPYSFGLFNLWRIAVDWPGAPVPPCIHRAPDTIVGQPRLLLIA